MKYDFVKKLGVKKKVLCSQELRNEPIYLPTLSNLIIATYDKLT